jgi:hypothetical protein
VTGAESAFLLPNEAGLPAGHTTKIVLTLQGDRLDPATAENKTNYRVTWLGPDGQRGTPDDQVIPLSSAPQAVVYSPSSNVIPGTGRTHPTAVRQTITLLFDAPLPAGSYLIDLSPQIQTADFNPDEDGLLSDGGSLAGHPLVQRGPAGVAEGAEISASNLVAAAAGQPNFSTWLQGTPFLSQLHDDLSAILDGSLTSRGDDPAISAQINDHLRDRLVPALAGAGSQRVLVLWLDPTGIDLEDSEGGSILYELNEEVVEVTMDDVFVDLIGNIEVIVIAIADELYELVVDNVPDLGRGGYVFIDGSEVESNLFTDELRDGETEFEIVLPE